MLRFKISLKSVTLIVKYLELYKTKHVLRLGTKPLTSMVHKGVLRAFLVRIYPFLHTKIYNKLILFAIRTQLPLTWT